MASARYLALLRGVNVGGRNKVPMADLRRAVEAAGYLEVSTYIASGNLLFTTDAPATQVEAAMEAVLEQHLGWPVVTVVRSHAQLSRVVAGAPDGFGRAPDTYHSDVVFLKAPVTGDQAMGAVSPREGVDTAWPGDGVMYFRRLNARITQSRMSTIVGTPEYRSMTIRSWSTTTKLLALLDAAGRTPGSVPR